MCLCLYCNPQPTTPTQPACSADHVLTFLTECTRLKLTLTLLGSDMSTVWCTSVCAHFFQNTILTGATKTTCGNKQQSQPRQLAGPMHSSHQGYDFGLLNQHITTQSTLAPRVSRGTMLAGNACTVHNATQCAGCPSVVAGHACTSHACKSHACKSHVHGALLTPTRSTVFPLLHDNCLRSSTRNTGLLSAKFKAQGRSASCMLKLAVFGGSHICISHQQSIKASDAPCNY